MEGQSSLLFLWQYGVSMSFFLPSPHFLTQLPYFFTQTGVCSHTHTHAHPVYQFNNKISCLHIHCSFGNLILNIILYSLKPWSSYTKEYILPAQNDQVVIKNWHILEPKLSFLYFHTCENDAQKAFHLLNSSIHLLFSLTQNFFEMQNLSHMWLSNI